MEYPLGQSDSLSSLTLTGDIPRSGKDFDFDWDWALDFFFRRPGMRPENQEPELDLDDDLISSDLGIPKRVERRENLFPLPLFFSQKLEL